MGRDSTTVVRQSPEDSIKANSFFDAIGLIQQISANEIDLPENMYPDTSKVSFSGVAVMHALRTTVLTFLASPVTMLVLEKYIHIFGNNDPGWADKLFSVLLSSAPSLGYSLFFAYIINKIYIRGKLTKSLLSCYVTPYIMMKLISTVFMFMLFVILTNNIMTPDNMQKVSRFLYDSMYIVNKGFAHRAHHRATELLGEVRQVLIKSAVYSTMVHMSCTAVIGLAYAKSYWRSYLIDILSRDFE